MYIHVKLHRRILTVSVHTYILYTYSTKKCYLWKEINYRYFSYLRFSSDKSQY